MWIFEKKIEKFCRKLRAHTDNLGKDCEGFVPFGQNFAIFYEKRNLVCVLLGGSGSAPMWFLYIIWNNFATKIPAFIFVEFDDFWRQYMSKTEHFQNPENACILCPLVRFPWFFEKQNLVYMFLTCSGSNAMSFLCIIAKDFSTKIIFSVFPNFDEFSHHFMWEMKDSGDYKFVVIYTQQSNIHTFLHKLDSLVRRIYWSCSSE